MTRLDEIATKIKAEGIKLTDSGLVNGQMGCFIFMLHYAHISGKSEYIASANDLFISLTTKLNNQTQLNYRYGKLGIAIGLLYLNQQKAFTVNGRWLYNMIDFHAHSTIIYDLSLMSENIDNRLIRIGYYLVLHIQQSNREKIDSMKKQFLFIHLLDILERFALPQTEWEKGRLLLFLEQAYSLDICNTKVVRIIKRIYAKNNLSENELFGLFNHNRSNILLNLQKNFCTDSLGLNCGLSAEGLYLLSQKHDLQTNWLNII